MRESMVFYKSFYDAVKDLPPKQFKDAMSAICEYGFEGKEDIKTPTAKTVLALVKPMIDKNIKRYENGCKGGRPTAEPEKPVKNKFSKMQESNIDFDALEKKVFKN